MLNAALIRERRIDLGYGRRELARLIGRSTGVVDGLERGTNHGEQTLATLAKLADALALTPADLFRVPATHEGRSDDVALEAALAFFGNGLAADSIARGLKWSLPRTRDAIKALRERLAPTGQHLNHNAGKFRLVYDRGALTADELTRLERERLTAFGMRKPEAEMLVGVLRGQVTSEWNRNKKGSTHITIGRLERLRYIAPGANGWHVTEAVEYSLGLRR